MKKFFKNNLKTILAVGATAIICISGTAFAAYYQYNAKQVEYKDGKSVEEALNDLYVNKTNTNHIEYGEITKTLPYRSWNYETITFEKEYTKLPEIYYEYKGGTSGGTVFITNITTTSFKIGYNNFYDSNRTDTIKWIALEK